MTINKSNNGVSCPTYYLKNHFDENKINETSGYVSTGLNGNFIMEMV